MHKLPTGFVYIGSKLNYLMYLFDPFPRGLKADLERSSTVSVHTLAMANTWILCYCTVPGPIQSTNRRQNHTKGCHICSSMGTKETNSIVTLVIVFI